MIDINGRNRLIMKALVVLKNCSTGTSLKLLQLLPLLLLLLLLPLLQLSISFSLKNLS